MIEEGPPNAGAHRNKRGGLAAKEDALMMLLEKARAACRRSPGLFWFGRTSV